MLWEQAVRRSGIPIAFSEGFNPKPRISYPCALALGIESEDEILILHLGEWLRPDEITRRLTDQFIEGIRITKIEPFSARQLLTVFEVTYKITWHDAPPPAPEILKNLLAQKEMLVTRSKPGDSKIINIRPYLKEISIQDNHLILVATVTPRGTVRPEEVIPFLGLPGSMAQGNLAIRKLKTNLMM